MQRTELADFLRRGERPCNPRMSGSPRDNGRRTAGLRREEVALLDSYIPDACGVVVRGSLFRPVGQTVAQGRVFHGRLMGGNPGPGRGFPGGRRGQGHDRNRDEAAAPVPRCREEQRPMSHPPLQRPRIPASTRRRGIRWWPLVAVTAADYLWEIPYALASVRISLGCDG